MKKFWVIAVICTIVFIGNIQREGLEDFIGSNPSPLDKYIISTKQDILCLWMAYPEDIVSLENDGGNIHIVMRSGKKILYDDRKAKTFAEKLQWADLQDMLEQIYPLGDIYELMDPNNDPGRIRNYALLKEVYGGTKEEVQSNLGIVKMGNQNLRFNSRNKARDHLQRVMQELVPLGNSNQNIRRALYPQGGTFNFRYISGTGLLSPHSFGIAIDLAKDDRDYWQWASREAGEQRLREYPRKIVEIFENNYFVWGGKWSHFDILHFEYRPELILKSMYFARNIEIDKSWYRDFPLDDKALEVIRIIDNTIR